MKAEIISIGTELLLGEITDTNASYLASRLPLLGIDLYWVSQVGDNQSRMLEVLRRAWQRSDLILTSGGLGPTDDDLTRETIAEMLGEHLEIDSSLENGLRERFGHRNMEMPLSNLKQVKTIPSAEPVTNSRGTAPGWWVAKDGRTLVAMPGPPAELQEMWQQEIQPRLKRASGSVILSRTIKTFGLSEAAVGEQVSALMSASNPTLGVYSRADGIQLRITAKAGSASQAAEMISQGEAGIRAVLEGYIWGVDDDTLETVIGRLLIEKGLSLAVIEDYSGGWLAANITDVPESPQFFKGGLVATSDEAKIASGVDPGLISQYGAVSPQVAEAMADAVRNLLKADIAVSTTGIGETATMPSGLAYIAISDGNNKQVIGRPRGKRRLTTATLLELRKLLLSG